MNDLISDLDEDLAEAGEDVILRRVVGTGSQVTNIEVTCRARVDVATTEQVLAGITATDLNVIISPTQINNAQWPGGQVQALPPFNVDQRVPRINGPDKMIVRGVLRTVAYSDPKFIGNELVRINLRVTG
jgi:hypothetical protein